MTALRFCFVTTFYPPYHFGGDAISVFRLVQSLAEAGHSVDVVHSVDAYRLQGLGEPEVSVEHHPNVRVHALRSRNHRMASLVAHQTGQVGMYGRTLRHVLEDSRPDVIHFHNVSLMGAPGVLSLGDAVKLYTPHEYWLVCPTHVLFAFGREACFRKRCLRCTLASRRPPQLWRLGNWRAAALQHIDCFVMLSEWALQRHREEGIDRPMVCIPHAVTPPQELDPANPYADPYFLFVGRLLRLKGVHDLIEMFRRYRRARLVIAGDGEDRAEFERLATGLDHVEFVGHVGGEALSRLYRNAVAVLMPSLCFEVAPLVPREAFGHGTPVIARRLGALPEVVEAPEIGWTFEHPRECVDAMDRLLDDPELRRERGRRAYRSAAGWTPENQLHEYLGLVKDLMGSRHGSLGRGESGGRAEVRAEP